MLNVEKIDCPLFYPLNEECRDYFLLQHWVKPDEMRQYYQNWKNTGKFCKK